MKRFFTLFTLLLGLWGLLASPSPAFASHSPDHAQVYLITPSDGETVPATFSVKFGLTGLGVAPAGVDVDNTGHHHLLVDTLELPSLSDPLPSTDRILHFGGGQTETTLTLSPGKHQLQLVFGNYLHIPYDEALISEPITVTVQ